MRKIGIILLLSCIITLTGFGLVFSKSGGQGCDEYIRIHIRADSDAQGAQAVKYKVRDAVVEWLTPLVAECESFSEAEMRLRRAEKELSKVGTQVLRSQGLSYEAQASVRREYFPLRTYGEYTLPAGEYLALVVELGEAQGQNWWCVIYPPLCFAGQPSVSVRYKSKIAEIIRSWESGR